MVDVVRADTMVDGWELWREWQRIVAPDNSVEIDTLTADAGRHLGYVRAVARRSDVEPDPPITSVPVSYRRHPVFRPESHASAGAPILAVRAIEESVVDEVSAQGDAVDLGVRGPGREHGVDVAFGVAPTGLETLCDAVEYEASLRFLRGQRESRSPRTKRSTTSVVSGAGAACTAASLMSSPRTCRVWSTRPADCSFCTALATARASRRAIAATSCGVRAPSTSAANTRRRSGSASRPTMVAVSTVATLPPRGS